MKLHVPLWEIGTVLVFIYRFLLDIIYFDFISVHYSYDHYYNFFDHRTAVTFILSWFVVVLSIPFMRHWMDERNENGSTDVMIFIYLISYIPFSTGVYAGIVSFSCCVLGIVYYFLLFGVHSIFCKRVSPRRILIYWDGVMANRLFIGSCILCIAFVIISVWFFYTGARLDINPLGKEIQLVRAASGGYHLPLAIRYIISGSTLVFSVLLIHFWIKRKYFVVIFLWSILFLRYTTDAMKTDFLLPLIVLMIAMFFKKFTVLTSRIFILLSFVALVLCGIGEGLSRANEIAGIIENYIFRRAVFVPVEFHEAYYQFFSMNDPDWFQGSFLRHFGFSSVYDAFGGIHNAIGNFLGFPEMAASNGLISDAIANLGIVGIVIMPVIIVLLLCLFDMCVSGMDRRLVIGSAFLLAWRLIPASFGSALLTYGILPMMGILLLIERKKVRLDLTYVVEDRS